MEKTIPLQSNISGLGVDIDETLAWTVGK